MKYTLTIVILLLACGQAQAVISPSVKNQAATIDVTNDIKLLKKAFEIGSGAGLKILTDGIQQIEQEKVVSKQDQDAQAAGLQFLHKQKELLQNEINQARQAMQSISASNAAQSFKQLSEDAQGMIAAGLDELLATPGFVGLNKATVNRLKWQYLGITTAA